MKHSRALRVALLATSGLLGLTVAAAYGAVYASRHRLCSTPVALTPLGVRPDASAESVAPNPFTTLSDEDTLALLAPATADDRFPDHEWVAAPVPDAVPEEEATAVEAVEPDSVDETPSVPAAPAASAAPSERGLDALERRRSELLGDGHDFVLTATAFLLFLAAAVTGLLSGHAGLEVLASSTVGAAAVKGAGLAAIAAIAASLVVAAVHAVANKFLNHLPQERMITFAVVSAVLAFGGFLATYLAAATLAA